MDEKLTMAGRKEGEGLTSFTLKVAAIAAMTLDHIGVIFGDQLPLAVTSALYATGGIVFPIMAFLIVEGYLHTSNVKHYATRLFIFALISEVPFWLFLDHRGDVLFTLFAGLIVIYLYDHMESRLMFWLACAAITVATALCDWGVVGVVVILLFYVLRSRPDKVTLPMVVLLVGMALPEGIMMLNSGSLENLPNFLFCTVGFTLAIPLLRSYDGRRGRPMKWFFYVYYPLHITLLGALFVLIY